jgi:excisionase family DNA binding protein
MSNNYQSPLLTINEAAEYLRIGRTSLYRLINSGQIETVKMLKRKQLIEQRVLDQLVSNPNSQTEKETNHDN